MFEPEVEYTYWPPEPPVPYVPYKGQQTATSYSQRQSLAIQSAATQTQAGIQRTQPPRLARAEQKKPVTPRMSKDEALQVVDQCKRWLVAGAIVAFGVLSGLIAGHAIGSASQSANPSNDPNAPSFNSPSNSPSNNGGFFQQGGNNFGNGNGGQPPFSGSHTS